MGGCCQRVKIKLAHSYMKETSHPNFRKTNCITEAIKGWFPLRMKQLLATIKIVPMMDNR